MKIIEITEDAFGESMELANKAKKALCELVECLGGAEYAHRRGGRHYPDYHDYRDFEMSRFDEEDYRRGGGGRGGSRM